MTNATVAVGSAIRRTRDRISRSIHTPQDLATGAQLIRRGIEAKRPYMICRIGSVELAGLRRAHLASLLPSERITSKLMSGHITQDLATNAGLHPALPQLAYQMCTRLSDDLGESDAIGVWHNYGESRLIARTAPNSHRFPLGSLNNIALEEPWSAALEGTRVVVVHPFAGTIKAQYAERRLLFPGNPRTLPDMDLSVVRAEQTIGGTHPTHRDWFETLSVVEDRMLASGADIALIACGSYGLPLAATAKRNGMIGIHVGGVLQLLFGIRGRRWDSRPDLLDMFNDSWVRPTEAETPLGADRVENACYW